MTTPSQFEILQYCSNASPYALSEEVLNCEMADTTAVLGPGAQGELKRFRFAEFLVDVGERVIFRGRGRVRLERQPFDVFVLLLRRPGQRVTRTEIEEQI